MKVSLIVLIFSVVALAMPGTNAGEVKVHGEKSQAVKKAAELTARAYYLNSIVENEQAVELCNQAIKLSPSDKALQDAKRASSTEQNAFDNAPFRIKKQGK